MIRVLPRNNPVSTTSVTTTLWDLPLHATAVLIGFEPTLALLYRGRLQEYGFHVGEDISCQHKPGFGAPRVYRVSNATYSLDRELAEQVLIRVTGGSGVG